MLKTALDKAYLERMLLSLLNIHSPSGYTDQIVHFVGNALQNLGITYDVTRRGAIRATLSGKQDNGDRAILVHLDTLGAMVRHCNAGYQVGDFVAFDAFAEISSNGFINARHLDDKAGVAVLLTAAKSIVASKIELPVDCHLIFTISEEVGSGASSAVYGDVGEMMVIDHAPVASGQNATEYGVTIGLMDQTGPFDFHLSRKLSNLCSQYEIVTTKDIFKFYRSDSSSAIEAGNDARTALVCFGVDASHGYERTHIDSLLAVANLVALYAQSAPTFSRDKDDLSSLKGFPHQPEQDVIQIET